MITQTRFQAVPSASAPGKWQVKDTRTNQLYPFAFVTYTMANADAQRRNRAVHQPTKTISTRAGRIAL